MGSFLTDPTLKTIDDVRERTTRDRLTLPDDLRHAAGRLGLRRCVLDSLGESPPLVRNSGSD